MSPRGPQTRKTDPPRRSRRFERASQLLAGHLRAPAEKRGFAETKLLTHWADIVGPDIAAVAMPLRITYGRGFGGTLVVLCTGAQAPLIEMQQAAIIDKVNACYGYSAISHVKVTQTAPTGFAEGQIAFQAAPKTAPERIPDPERLAKATRDIDTIEDPSLREALTALARNIVNNNSN